MIIPNRQRESASVLVLTLILCAILGLLMGSYLYLVQTQQLSVASAQAWNSALVVAEGGIEEAMAHLNSGITTNNLAVNSWAKLDAGIYSKTNVLGSSYAAILIKLPPAVTNTSPVVFSTGYVPGPIRTPKVFRTVSVQTKPKPAVGVNPGMIVRTTINLNGSKVSMDSFDSSNTNYSTGGVYDPAKARDRAEVTTISSATNAIIVDNGKIKGTLHTGPGGKISINSNGSVGDEAWVNGGKAGVQSGHSKDDANLVLSDVVLPQVKSWLPPVAGKYKINGDNYDYLLNNSSAWKLSSLSGAVYVNSSNVTLYVTDTFDITTIHVAAGASLSIYASCPTVSLKGQGIVNDTGAAKNVKYFGLPGNTNLSMGANAAVTAQIYAPNAVFKLGGGGNNTYDFVGSCAVNSVVMGGHFHFHYDEGLINELAASGYLVSSWDEL